MDEPELSAELSSEKIQESISSLWEELGIMC